MYWQGIRIDSVKAPLVGEAGFVPVRKPNRRHLEAVTREDIRPGMRQIDGRWFYSSRWL